MNWRVPITGAALVTAFSVVELVMAGTFVAAIQAALCVGVPVAMWAEARRLRKRGASEAAETLVVWAMLVSFAFAYFAEYTAEHEQMVCVER